MVYLLHGYPGTDSLWAGHGYLRDLNIRTIPDALLDDGMIQPMIQPMILGMPNAHNRYWGSYYTNSSATGNWEDFIVDELVKYVDGAHRTLAQPASRGINGYSMGGYGAMTLAMKHPETFCAVYAMSGASFGNSSWNGQ